MPAWLVSSAGLAVVAFVLIDMFHTLANPGALGRLSRTMLRGAWTISGKSQLSGPVAMLAVTIIWGAVAVLGWAVVYVPHMDSGFSTSVPPGEGNDWLNAVYVSSVTISTLGLGDVFPTTGWLRLVNPLEALFGFALLTVAVSWVLQVFPALTRRRELALRLTHLGIATDPGSHGAAEAAVPFAVVDDLAVAVRRVRIDLRDYPETYYFREPDDDASLPAALAVAVRLADTARRSTSAEMRLGGAVLAAALADLAHVLDERFLHHGGTVEDVFEAFRLDHGGTI